MKRLPARWNRAAPRVLERSTGFLASPSPPPPRSQLPTPSTTAELQICEIFPTGWEQYRDAPVSQSAVRTRSPSPNLDHKMRRFESIREFTRLSTSYPALEHRPTVVCEEKKLIDLKLAAGWKQQKSSNRGGKFWYKTCDFYGSFPFTAQHPNDLVSAFTVQCRSSLGSVFGVE